MSSVVYQELGQREEEKSGKYSAQNVSSCAVLRLHPTDLKRTKQITRNYTKVLNLKGRPELKSCCLAGALISLISTEAEAEHQGGVDFLLPPSNTAL